MEPVYNCSSTDGIVGVAIVRTITSFLGILVCMICLATQIYMHKAKRDPKYPFQQVSQESDKDQKRQEENESQEQEPNPYERLNLRILTALSTTSISYMVILFLQSLQFYAGSGPTKYCLFMAYSSQAFFMTQLLLVLCFAFVADKKNIASVWWLELLTYIIFICTIFTLNSTPFWDPQYRYEDLGPWCGIVTINNTDCSTDDTGITLTIYLWYSPSIIILVGIISMKLYSIYYRRTDSKADAHFLSKARWCTYITLGTAFGLLIITWVLEIASMTLTSFSTSLAAWYFHSITVPAKGTLTLLAFTLYNAFQRYAELYPVTPLDNQHPNTKRSDSEREPLLDDRHPNPKRSDSEREPLLDNRHPNPKRSDSEREPLLDNRHPNPKRSDSEREPLLGNRHPKSKYS